MGWGLAGGLLESRWRAGWVVSQRTEGAVARQEEALVLPSEDRCREKHWSGFQRTDVGKGTGLDFSTLPLTCVILCTSTVPLGPLLTEQDNSPWRPPRF